MKEENLRLRDHEPEELAFYSKATTDYRVCLPVRLGRAVGHGGPHQLRPDPPPGSFRQEPELLRPETNEHYIPYVIEPSLGCDRVALAFLCEAYDEEHLVDAKGKDDVRTVLHLHPALAPYKCAVLPLSKKLGDKAMEIRNELSKDFMVDYDDTGSIGKRYRREDEIGTPYCITVDFDTVGDEAKVGMGPIRRSAGDNCVTVRDRDTMEQVRMPISELKRPPGLYDSRQCTGTPCRRSGPAIPARPAERCCTAAGPGPPAMPARGGGRCRLYGCPGSGADRPPADTRTGTSRQDH